MKQEESLPAGLDTANGVTAATTRRDRTRCILDAVYTVGRDVGVDD